MKRQLVHLATVSAHDPLALGGDLMRELKMGMTVISTATTAAIDLLNPEVVKDGPQLTLRIERHVIGG